MVSRTVKPLAKPFKKTNESFQNKNGSYSTGYWSGQKSKGSSQHLTMSWFYKSLPNINKVLRSSFIFAADLFANNKANTGTSIFIFDMDFFLWNWILMDLCTYPSV